MEKYQEVKRPEGRNEPDYASKIHIVTAPVYYHNYMLGAVVRLAGAPRHRPRGAPRRRSGDGGLRGDKAAGAFMRERVFTPGCTMDWRQLTRFATGEDLNPKAMAEDFSKP